MNSDDARPTGAEDAAAGPPPGPTEAAPGPATDEGGRPEEESEPFLRVTEIFHSIQGESTWAGIPCTFVRLTGCPLRCEWCDTAYSFHGGERMSLGRILERVDDAAASVVEITGGEPLIHPNAVRLADALLEAGYTVLVETSGAVDVSDLDPRVHTIMDLKCPGSGESSRNRWKNLEHLGDGDEIKFVIRDRRDYEWAREVIRERGLDDRVRRGDLRAVLLSPVWGELERRNLAEWILEDGLPVRFQIQLHKEIWDAEARGV